MANVPEDLHYSKDHEWVQVKGDGAIVGIPDYAQNSLGDVVYVELPKVGEEFAAHESFGSVESVKAVSEVFSPVTGANVAQPALAALALGVAAWWAMRGPNAFDMNHDWTVRRRVVLVAAAAASLAIIAGSRPSPFLYFQF